MRIKRRYIEDGKSPFDGIAFRIGSATNKTDTTSGVDVPVAWPTDAARAFGAGAPRRFDVPARLRPVREDDVPPWLWKHVADDAALGEMAPGERTGGESSARDVFDRMAGGLTYCGWRGGYFDGEADAAAFRDEFRYLLCTRSLIPASERWRVAGLYWAYGLSTTDRRHYAVDFRSGQVTHGEAEHEPHRGMHIGDGDGEATNLVDLCATRADARGWVRTAEGVRFTRTAAQWLTCPRSGTAMWSSDRDGFVFVGDTACPLATLDAAGFVAGDGAFDIDGFVHAVRVATIALDISLTMTAYPSRTMAAAVWDHRPLGLGLDNVAGLAMATGLEYDSAPARALAAAVAALMTGTAYAVSAEMAALLGTFPEYEVNRRPMQRALRNQLHAAHGKTTGYQALTRPPLALDRASCPSPGIAEQACLAWDRAVEAGDAHGYRNAHVTLVAGTQGAVTGEPDGVAPARPMVHASPHRGSGVRRALPPVVVKGLRALGYDDRAVTGIAAHVLGRGTLTGAPAINPQRLVQRGMDPDAIQAAEAALTTARDIRHVFDGRVLGVRAKRGRSGDAANDLLTVLGFDADAIERANVYCCGAGTLDGAPGLDPAHVAVFEGPAGDDGQAGWSAESQIRMMAAVQPFLSGGVGTALRLPPQFGFDKAGALFQLAWRLGLKSVAVGADDAESRAAADGGGLRLMGGGRHDTASPPRADSGGGVDA